MLTRINEFARSYDILEEYIPLLADVFVLTYPFYLTAVYLWAMAQERLEIKIWALHIFFSVFFSSLVSQVIKFFIYKSRPWESGFPTENMIFEHVPTRAFPSDHGTVSMAMALGSIFRWVYKENVFFMVSGVVFLIFSLIMSFSRVTAWVHRVTDILAGWVVAFVVSLLMIKSPLYDILVEKLYKPLISLQVWLFSLVWIDK